MKEFRLLKAEEIITRVQSCKEKGVVLLLYKDARVDQNILDEKFGIFGWQREHNFKEGINYCKVSVLNPKTGTWVSKEDCGVESNTDAQKGESSDAFKRACFNLGIGRELYSAPFIWIGSDKCKITSIQSGGKTVYKCNDSFSVVSISYDDEENIKSLEIKNESTGKICFTFGVAKKTPSTKSVSQKTTKSGTIVLDEKLLALVTKYNVNIPKLAEHLKKEVEELTNDDLKMAILAKKKSLATK